MDKMLPVLWENVLDNEQKLKTSGDLSQELETYLTQPGSPSVSGKPIKFKRLSSLLCLTLSLTGCTQTCRMSTSTHTNMFINRNQRLAKDTRVSQRQIKAVQTHESALGNSQQFGESLIETIWANQKRQQGAEYMAPLVQCLRAWGPEFGFPASMWKLDVAIPICNSTASMEGWHMWGLKAPGQPE